MADCSEFPIQLANAGVTAEVHEEILGFEFHDFESAWKVLAGVTNVNWGTKPERRRRSAVRELMWDDVDAPRYLRNTTLFIGGRRS